MYSPLQKILHWTTALIVLAMIPMGFYMVWRYFATDNDAITVTLFNSHKLAGFLLLWLVLARLVTRIVVGTPPPPATLSKPQRVAAEATHGLIYVLLLAVPVAGWAGASAYGLLDLPGGLNLPEIVGRNDDLAGRILWWHGWGGIALAVLVGLHISAALLHRVYFKDGVFERMWPGSRGGRTK
jgi:cytochrome b561